MKIIILGTAWPYRGGLATFNERLARQFQDEGHDVQIWTFTLQYPAILFPGKTQYTSDPAPKNLQIDRRLNSCNPFNWLRIARQLKRLQPDVLICCYWMAFFAPLYGTICRIVKRNRHTRCVALVHNMFPHEKSVLDKLFAPYFVHSQDAFVALSESVVKDIHTLTNAPATSSPHPIYDHYGARLSKEDACARIGLNPDKQYMLFFGLVRAYKGLDLLLDAMGKLKDTLPNVNLLIAGEFYEDEDKYRQQIAQEGLTERVIIRNEFIPDGELAAYFGASDLIVQPYKSATQSGVTQVAFHFEKPILVTNVGGLGEIVHHGKMGYAVTPDAQEIASSIEDYFSHHRQQDFTAYLQKEKLHYGWNKLTMAFKNIL
ncbi:MAG: glycosyltransferase family 4 protein [Paludibacteraceae bacterium]|nr:glycosyltransferase family 4 protein [Paludibacteraceae bacterium]